MNSCRLPRVGSLAVVLALATSCYPEGETSPLVPPENPQVVVQFADGASPNDASLLLANVAFDLGDESERRRKFKPGIHSLVRAAYEGEPSYIISFDSHATPKLIEDVEQALRNSALVERVVRKGGTSSGPQPN